MGEWGTLITHTCQLLSWAAFRTLLGKANVTNVKHVVLAA